MPLTRRGGRWGVVGARRPAGVGARRARGGRQLAAIYGHLPVAKRLLAASDIQVEKRDVMGRTALHLAAQHGRVKIIKLLVATGGADVHAADRYGDTPLHVAARHNQPEATHALATIEEDFVRLVLAGACAAPFVFGAPSPLRGELPVGVVVAGSS